MDFSQIFSAFGQLDLGSVLLNALIVSGVLRLAGDGVAQTLAPIPLLGPILAPIVRALSGSLEGYLQHRVPSLANVAVQATEEYAKVNGDRGEAKWAQATEVLRRMAPDLTPDQIADQLNAALSRLRAEGLEQKADR